MSESEKEERDFVIYERPYGLTRNVANFRRISAEGVKEFVASLPLPQVTPDIERNERYGREATALLKAWIEKGEVPTYAQQLYGVEYNMKSRPEKKAERTVLEPVSV